MYEFMDCRQNQSSGVIMQELRRRASEGRTYASRQEAPRPISKAATFRRNTEPSSLRVQNELFSDRM